MTILIMLLLMLFAVLDAQNLPQSDIQLSDSSEKFQPANSIELLETLSVSSLLQCGYACNLNVQCRTFDYDSSSLVCHLFEGALDTGHIVSASSTSRVGSLEYFPIFFNAYQHPCSQCTDNRYLICLNNTCQCPLYSFWNGSQCENQRYENASCLSDEWCRNDPFGLICSVANVCIIPSTQATVSSTTTSATSTTTSATSTTTTTTPSCTTTPGANLLNRTSGAIAWTQFAYNYTATSMMPTLIFGFQSASVTYNYLDDVSVVDNNGPSIELLINPSFENSTTSLTGWGTWCATTVNCGSGFPGQVLSNSNCHSGNCYYDHCHSTFDYLIQSFPATIGDTYTISFWLQQTGNTTIKFYANIQN